MTIFKNCFKSFSDPILPDIIFIDSSFIVPALITGTRLQGNDIHVPCQNFLNRLQKQKPKITLCYSALLKPELWCTAIRIAMRNVYGSKIDVSDMIKKDPKLIQVYYPYTEQIEKNFNNILLNFDSIMFPINEGVLAKAFTLMSKYCFSSYDAIHVATAEENGIKDIVVIDKDYLGLPHFNSNYNIWSLKGYCRFKERKHLYPLPQLLE